MGPHGCPWIPMGGVPHGAPHGGRPPRGPIAPPRPMPAFSPPRARARFLTSEVRRATGPPPRTAEPPPSNQCAKRGGGRMDKASAYRNCLWKAAGSNPSGVVFATPSNSSIFAPARARPCGACFLSAPWGRPYGDPRMPMGGAHGGPMGPHGAAPMGAHGFPWGVWGRTGSHRTAAMGAQGFP